MVLMMGIAACMVLVDVATKAAAVRKLAESWRVVVVENLLELRLTRNDGMALGILSGNMFAIILLPLAVIFAGYLLLKRYHLTNFTRVAGGLVLGGFLGNFIERVLQGYVVDMIYFPFMPLFVCNMADVAICAGVVMLGASLLLRPQDWREKHAKDHRDGAV